MRLLVLLLLGVLILPVAWAAPPAVVQALEDPVVAHRRAAVVDLAKTGTMNDVPLLVKRLRDGNADIRVQAEEAVWGIWERSGDRAIDLMFRQGVRQMQIGANADALATFTRIIKKKPDFAEAWNKRATVYYNTGDYQASLRDCDEVIKRNPLHFSALAGYGLNYIELDDPERALDYFQRALAINPNMPKILNYVEELRHRIEEERKNFI
jgi:tetratricopeptide (TPR) repeat protein